MESGASPASAFVCLSPLQQVEALVRAGIDVSALQEHYASLKQAGPLSAAHKEESSDCAPTSTLLNVNLGIDESFQRDAIVANSDSDHQFDDAEQSAPVPASPTQTSELDVDPNQLFQLETAPGESHSHEFLSESGSEVVMPSPALEAWFARLPEARSFVNRCAFKLAKTRDPRQRHAQTEEVMVSGGPQSGKTVFAAAFAALAMQHMIFTIVISRTSDLCAKLEADLQYFLESLVPSELCMHLRAATKTEIEKLAFVISRHGVIIVNQQSSCIGQILRTICELRGGGFDCDFVLIKDESDALHRTSNSVLNAERALNALEGRGAWHCLRTRKGPRLVLNLTSCPVPVLLRLRREARWMAASNWFQCNPADYAGQMNLTPFQGSFLHADELNCGNGFWSEKVEQLYASAHPSDCSLQKSGILLIDTANPHLNTGDSMEKRALRIQAQFCRFVVVQIWGSGGIAVRYPGRSWIQGATLRALVQRSIRQRTTKKSAVLSLDQMVENDRISGSERVETSAETARLSLRDVLESLDHYDPPGHWQSRSEAFTTSYRRPVVVLGFSRMIGETFRSAARVPSHMLCALTAGRSLATLYRMIGRAMYRGVRCKVQILTIWRDWDSVCSMHNFHCELWRRRVSSVMHGERPSSASFPFNANISAKYTQRTVGPRRMDLVADFTYCTARSSECVTGASPRDCGGQGRRAAAEDDDVCYQEGLQWFQSTAFVFMQDPTNSSQTSSILRRSMGSVPAPGIVRTWIACVRHQMYHESKISYKSSQANGSEVVTETEEEVMEQVTIWLRRNNDQMFVMAPGRKGPGASLHSKGKDQGAPAADSGRGVKRAADGQAKGLTVEDFCKRQYGIVLDAYIKKLQSSEAPGYELACFAMTQSYDCVRLAVLRPKSIEDKATKAWQIWDSGKQSSKRIVLKIADSGLRRFYSLVSREDWSSQVPAEAASDNVLGADMDEDGAAVLSPKHQDREFRPCRTCGKQRWFRIGGGAGGSFHCSDNDMEMEKHCKDPAIYDQIRRFGVRGTYSKKIEDKLLNLAYLFMLVQAAGSLEELIKQRKLTEVGKLLGAMPEKAAAGARQMKSVYESVFRSQKPQKDGGMSLERLLQREEGVLQALKLRGPKLRKSLGLAENSRHRISEIAEGQQLPRLFVGVASTPRRSEEVTRIMREVWEAATQWADYAERRRDRRPRWADAVNEIVDLSRQVWCAVRRSDDMSLAMVGNTGVGKSFLMDCILRMSEADRSQYAAGEGAAGLEAQEYLDNLARAARGAEDEVKRSVGCEMYEADAGRLEEYCRHSSGGRLSVLQQEQEAANKIAEFCTTESRADFRSFLLPSYNPANSTTACAISSRRGRRYQVVLEYVSRQELVAEWQQYGKLRESKKKSAKKKVDLMEAQVAQAMGGAGDLAVKQLLQAFNPSKLAEQMPELDRVLGKRVGFAGAGLSAVEDRVIVRAILSNCQGLRDQFTHDIAIDPMSPCGHQLLSGDGESRTQFGRRTFFALRKIILFAPCDILPVTESEWVDSPGCEDGDLIKQKMLKDELSRAEAVVVLLSKNLKASEATTAALRESKAFTELIRVLRGGKQDRGRVSLLQNLEKTLSSKEEKVTPEVLERHLGDTDVTEGKEESARMLQSLVKDCVEAVEAGEERMSDEAVSALGKQVCENVPTTIAAFKFATSVVLNTDQKSLPETTRQQWLEQSKIFDLLGVVEKSCGLARGAPSR